MSHRVVFSPEARDDLIELYDYIADHSGPARAIGYIDRIEAFCRALSEFPARGTVRDDIRPGLRVIGFERRTAVAFHLQLGEVIIDRVLYGGRDLAPALGDD